MIINNTYAGPLAFGAVSVQSTAGVRCRSPALTRSMRRFARRPRRAADDGLRTVPLIAIGAPPSNDGIVDILGATGTGVFAAAAVDIGAAGTITATADDGGAGFPITLTLCQTDPGTGEWTNSPQARWWGHPRRDERRGADAVTDAPFPWRQTWGRCAVTVSVRKRQGKSRRARKSPQSRRPLALAQQICGKVETTWGSAFATVWPWQRVGAGGRR
jgi:hypothetical protein